MYVCICSAVSERQLHAAIAAGARSLPDLARVLGMGTACGKCHECAQSHLDRLCAPLETRGRDGACAPPA
jgi:bacterioferritin-associated ferredoxin